MSHHTYTHTHTEEDGDYLELHQVDVHVSPAAVLSHRVCELRDPVAGGPQPGLDLRQVEDHLPVGAGVERRGFSGPAGREGPIRVIATPGEEGRGGGTSCRRLLPADSPPQDRWDSDQVRTACPGGGPGSPG